MRTERKPQLGGNVIPFDVYIKDLVRRKFHTGKCTTCERPFGTLTGWEGQEKLMSVHLHCPKCGSGHIVSLKRAGVVVTMGDLQIVSKGCYCRKCGHEFNEMDVFTHCEAAPPAKEIKAIQKAQQVTQSMGMSPMDFVKKLAGYQQEKYGKVSESVKAVVEKTANEEPKPGTPEWYEAHPEES